MKKYLVLLITMAFSVLLCSCSSYSQGGYEFDPGETLTPELLESVFSADTELPENGEEFATEQIVIDENTDVYFTDGGSKYHIFRDCQSIIKSETVKSCKLSEAAENGKGECCKHCQKRAGIDEPEE